MIHIRGNVQRAFTFPADLAATRAYLSDFRRLLTLLPHIRLVKAYGTNRFRVLYHTVELGVYAVRIYCDLHAGFVDGKHILRVSPNTDFAPVPARVTLTSLTAQGNYQSDSIFHAHGSQTKVDYHIRLGATLPKPLGLDLMPDRVVEQIARNIVTWRMSEIADGFVERAIHDYERRERRGPKRSARSNRD
jgi:hypothetical protein